jgi:hypothetical protein
LEDGKMSKFRKKPVVIEAFQFTGWTGFFNYAPKWAHELTGPGTAILLENAPLAPRPDVAVEIKTREGVMRADIGDWIIKGIEGELYPCKPGIFAETYEAAA